MRISRRGFVIGLAVVMIPILLLLVFSYSNQVRQEALRAHRVYWNDLVTKAAEGVAVEAYDWFLTNQNDPANVIAAFLMGKPGGARIMALTNTQLQMIDCLKTAYNGNNVISQVTIALATSTPFFKPVAFPPPGFNAATDGQLYPDVTDTFGLLKVEIEANFHGFKRKYVVMRDVKCVTICPGIFGQFTLFVKEKKDGMEYDWNHLKGNSSDVGPVLDASGFIKRDANELSNPVVLIHDKNDSIRSCNISEIHDKDVSPTPGPDWTTLDLTKRGWVFLGRSTTSGPLQNYIFHPLNGDAKSAATPAGLNLPAGIPTDPWLFFGGNFLLSNHTKLWYLLRVNDSSLPDWPHIPLAPVGAKFAVPPSTPLLGDASRNLNAWIVWQSRFGFSGFSKSLLQSFGLYHLVKNYYEDPRHNVGDEGEAGKQELPYASLILPLGDLFPANSSTMNDRRSPTVLLGAWLKFLQTGNIMQIDDTIKSALDLNPVGDWQALTANPPNTIMPTIAWLPYFPIHANRQINPPAVSFGPEPDFVGWSSYATWGKVDDSTIPGIADFSKVTYNIIDHVMTSFGDVRNPYEIVMTKLITVPGMLMYDQIVGNNMRGQPKTLFVPDPAGTGLKLNAFPSALEQVLKSVNAAGALVTGTNQGKNFFYTAPDSTTQAGRGISGECIALKDTADRPLAIGNLGALWPFSSTFDLTKKATHVASTTALFQSNFTKVDGGNLLLDLKNGIVLVRGDLVLQAPSGGKIIYKSGGMLIASDGEILVKSPIQRDSGSPEATLVLATAKTDKHIKLAAGAYQAFFLSSGTLKRETAGAIKIEGGVAVKYLEFKKEATSWFIGYPSSADTRQTILWDANFNVFDPGTYQKSMKLHLGGSMVYWTSEKSDL
ncbi:MAG: hypothetical protein WA705_29330 [Candidatus Ozemobacteraceae bacterium]